MLTNPPAVTSLDPDETNAPLGIPTNGRVFRHSFWQARRAATFEALQHSGVSNAVCERFELCGTEAWLVKAVERRDTYRIHSATCHNRWCEACGKERRLIVTRNIVNRVGPNPIRFLTLTLRSLPEPLADQIHRLYKSFKLLRNRKDLKKFFVGGVAFLEVTYSESKGLWHPHLHVLLEGPYTPQQLISMHWHQITGDSFIVHVKALRDGKIAAAYVTKYSSKGVSPNIWRNRERFVEAMIAIRGTRLFNTFGTWRDMPLTSDPDDGLTWEPICRLELLLERSRLGDPDFLRLLELVRSKPSVAATPRMERPP